MGKGARFDHDFLLVQTEKRKAWKAKGKRAGHGGAFSIPNPLADINRQLSSVMTPPAIANTSATVLVDKSELPTWLISILESDNDIAHAVVNKKVEVESPHKARLVQAIKRPKEVNDTRQAEHWLQVRIFYTLERKYPSAYRLAFAIPNGGYRTPKAAATMKYEGQKAGVPDIFFPIPKGAYHGFFLEVKTDKGRPSQDQLMRIKELREQGYFVEVAKGFDEAMSLVEQYLNFSDFNSKI